MNSILGKGVLNAEASYLDQLVPSSADNYRVLGIRREANARDPVGVALVGDGEFAVSESVPQLDCSIAGARNDLSVVCGEGNGEDIVGVADKGTGGVTGRELPQSKSLVPGRRQGIGTVRGDHTVGNNVRVAVQRSLRVSVGSFIAGQVPDDQAFVSRTRQQHIRAKKRSSVSESCERN